MAFGAFEVHAGDFKKGKSSQFAGDHFLMKVTEEFFRQKIPATELEVLEIATEENVKQLGGTLGWGLAGGLLLGPVGLLAGLLAGGRSKQVTFVATFKDGRKFLGTADSKTFTKMQAAIF